MPQLPFDWTLVRSFLAVLEAGSLLGAARRLGMHQPTLSRHVAQLEAHQLSNLLSREADIAVRMVRPAQSSLLARKVADIGLGIYAHTRYLARAGVPRLPEDLLMHQLIGFDQDPSVLQGFARMGMPMAREQFSLRTDDQVAYGELVRSGAGIGFLAHYVAGRDAALVRVLPGLRLPTLPCWLAVHREIRASRVVRTVFDHLARALPVQLRTLEAAAAPAAPGVEA